MRQKTLWFDLAVCSVWALVVMGGNCRYTSTPYFLMLLILVSRMALSFVLYRGERRGWVTLAMFMGLSALAVLTEADRSFYKLIYIPFCVSGIEYDRNAAVVIALVVAAWLWLMPLVAYIVALCRKKLTRTGLTYRELLGSILWRDVSARAYSQLMLMAVMALFSGLAMYAQVCWYVCLVTPMLSLWLLCRYYQVETGRLWLMPVAMAVFYYAQSSYGMMRMALLGISLLLVAYLCARFYRVKAMPVLSVAATLYLGILLPTLAIGNNQYTCMNYPRAGFYHLDSYPGIFYVRNPQTGTYGLRDRYGLLVAPEYDNIVYHTVSHYFGTLELSKNGYYTLYDICNNKMVKSGDIDHQLQDSICQLLNDFCLRHWHDFGGRMEVKVTGAGNEGKVLSHIKMLWNGYKQYYYYDEAPYISMDTVGAGSDEFHVDSTTYACDHMYVGHVVHEVSQDSTSLYSVDIKARINTVPEQEGLVGLANGIGALLKR